MEIYEVNIVNINTQEEVKIAIEVDEAEETELIVFHAWLNIHEIVSSDLCYFTAFQQFRDTLLSLGYGMKCKGAYVNAVQPPIMRISDRIYLVSKGNQPTFKDAVGMFEYADLNEFCNTVDQINYFYEWCESLVENI